MKDGHLSAAFLRCLSLAALLLPLAAPRPAVATYDPRHGRWLQRDPIGTGAALASVDLERDTSGGSVLWQIPALDRRPPSPRLHYVDGLNIYQFCQSRPGTVVDPTGLRWWCNKHLDCGPWKTESTEVEDYAIVWYDKVKVELPAPKVLEVIDDLKGCLGEYYEGPPNDEVLYPFDWQLLDARKAGRGYLCSISWILWSRCKRDCCGWSYYKTLFTGRPWWRDTERTKKRCAYVRTFGSTYSILSGKYAGCSAPRPSAVDCCCSLNCGCSCAVKKK